MLFVFKETLILHIIVFVRVGKTWDSTAGKGTETDHVELPLCVRDKQSCPGNYYWSEN